MSKLLELLAKFASNFFRGLAKDKRHEKSIEDNTTNQNNQEATQDALDKVKEVHQNSHTFGHGSDANIFDQLREPSKREKNSSR